MQFPTRTGPLVNDAAPFSVEMIAGWQPDRIRLFLAPRIPLPSGDPLFGPAAPPMIETLGSKPDSPRIKLGPRIPLPYTDNPIPAPFSHEMVVGQIPTRPRITYGRQIALPDSQLLHVSAPITNDMISAFTLPAQPRLPRLNPSYPAFFGTVPLESFQTIMGDHIVAIGDLGVLDFVSFIGEF